MLTLYLKSFIFVFLSENNRLATPQSAAPAPVVITGSLAHQHTARQISGTTAPPTAGSALVNSPKTTRLRNGLSTNNSFNAPANRLRSKESSPELVNGGGAAATGVGLSLEKRILDAIVLLNQNKYSVLDDGQQKEAGAKVARLAAMETELQVQSRGVVALGVLVNYLVTDVSTNICGCCCLLLGCRLD